MNNINQSIVPIHLWIISCKITTPIDVNNNQLYHFHDNGKLEFILSHCKQLSKDGRQQNLTTAFLLWSNRNLYELIAPIVLWFQHMMKI
jgi:hypothetical protein